MVSSVVITSKARVAELTESALRFYESGESHLFIQNYHNNILKSKIKFPVLEHSALILHQRMKEQDQVPILDQIIALDEIGSYVVAGKILQLHLPLELKKSIQLACDYMIQGNVWYACDIIGERVMGHALLTYPEKSIPLIKNLAKQENKWLVRSVGVANHYATKKGLEKKYVGEMFEILFSLSSVTEFHTKTGIGWGVKTIAKFHPDIIANNKSRIEYDNTVRQWFKTKIEIGLGRSEKYKDKYAH